MAATAQDRIHTPRRHRVCLPALAPLLLVAASATPAAPALRSIGVPLPEPAAVDAQLLAPFVRIGSAPVAPGATHDWGTMTTPNGGQRVNIVTADPYRPETSFETALSNDRITGLETTTSMALRKSEEGHRVVAAVNGDVWTGTTTLLGTAPNGIHIERGELVSADWQPRATFGVGFDRVPRIGQVTETMTLTVATASFPIGHVNQAPNGSIAIFTPRFGSNLSPQLTGYEVVVTGFALPIAPVGLWSGVVTEIRPAGSGAPIDPSTVVLLLPADSLALLDLAPGVPVSVNTTITPGWEGVTEAVSGRGMLIRDGAPFIYPFPSNGNIAGPRTALGLTADGRVLMVTVDGRDPGWSAGATADDIASLLLSLGAVQAINLDGGSSSTLAVRQPGNLNVSLANVPSGGYDKAVTDSLQLVLHVPTGPLASLTLSPSTPSLYPTERVQYRLIGLDAACNPVSLTSDEVAWSTDPRIGTVDATGRFLAVAPGVAQVTATARGVVASAPVEVLADTSLPVVPAPVTSLPGLLAIGPSVPVILRWSAATDVGSGVASLELQRSVDGGEFVTIARPAATATSASLGLPRNRTYAFRIRALDRAGNAGAWAAASRFRLAAYQETTSVLRFLKGTWLRTSSTSYDGGWVRTTRTTGAVARFTFNGSGFDWIAAKSPLRGSAGVSVDGGAAVTVSLFSTTSVARRMVFSRSWAASAAHTVTITVLGTAGHPRVDIDAFVVLGRS